MMSHDQLAPSLADAAPSLADAPPEPSVGSILFIGFTDLSHVVPVVHHWP